VILLFMSSSSYIFAPINCVTVLLVPHTYSAIAVLQVLPECVAVCLACKRTQVYMSARLDAFIHMT